MHNWFMQRFETLETEMILRNYSPRTRQAYIYANQQFLQFVKKPPDEIRNSDLQGYMLHLAKRKLSSATRHLVVGALRFYYCEILKRRFKFTYPKVSKKLPLVISKDQIIGMIKATPNLKHKLLITLLYSSGLRISEAVKIKYSDLDMPRRRLIVREGKGGKDRIAILSETFLKMVCDIYKRGEYIFYSNKNPSHHLCVKSAQNIVQMAGNRIGINMHCHAFRSSFATHLIENSTDIHLVQKLLGHSSIQSTQGYLKIADKALNVKSPLD